MRLYLLPISTRRTLLYCQRSNLVPGQTAAGSVKKATWPELIQDKVAKTWAGWEKKEKGWQKKVVTYGNQAFRRIPYEEWGLKSVPTLSRSREKNELAGTDLVEVVYPKSLIDVCEVPEILHKLSTERESLHRRSLTWCFVGMPLTAPIAIIPVIPNLPFFYLAWRAYSNWKALRGGKHIQFLLQNNLLALTPSAVLDLVYGTQSSPLASTRISTTPTGANDSVVPESSATAESRTDLADETMLLTHEMAIKLCQALDLAQLEVELERAIWQVERAIRRSEG